MVTHVESMVEPHAPLTTASIIKAARYLFLNLVHAIPPYQKPSSFSIYII